MIAKITKGKGAAGLLSYLLKQQHRNLIGDEWSASALREVAFGGQPPRVEPKWIYHCSIRLADGETLSDDRWIELAKRVVDHLHLAGPLKVIQHRTAEDGEHIHIVTTLRLAGKNIEPRNDFYRIREVLRSAERDWNLSDPAQRQKTNFKMGVMEAAATSPDLPTFQKKLEKLGYRLEFIISPLGEVKGVHLIREKDGLRVKASSVDRRLPALIRNLRGNTQANAVRQQRPKPGRSPRPFNLEKNLHKLARRWDTRLAHERQRSLAQGQPTAEYLRLLNPPPPLRSAIFAALSARDSSALAELEHRSLGAHSDRLHKSVGILSLATLVLQTDAERLVVSHAAGAIRCGSLVISGQHLQALTAIAKGIAKEIGSAASPQASKEITGAIRLASTLALLVSNPTALIKCLVISGGIKLVQKISQGI